jgi:hypothetical protein
MSVDEPPTKMKKFNNDDSSDEDIGGDESDLEEFDEETEESSLQDGQSEAEFTKEEWFRPKPKETDVLRLENLI